MDGDVVTVTPVDTIAVHEEGTHFTANALSNPT